jgi:hypothetical protein
MIIFIPSLYAFLARNFYKLLAVLQVVASRPAYNCDSYLNTSLHNPYSVQLNLNMDKPLTTASFTARGFLTHEDSVLVSTPVVEVFPAEFAAPPSSSTAMPPPKSTVPMGRLLLPYRSGRRPIAVIYGKNGVLKEPEPPAPTPRVPTPMPGAVLPAEEPGRWNPVGLVPPPPQPDHNPTADLPEEEDEPSDQDEESDSETQAGSDPEDDDLIGGPLDKYASPEEEAAAEREEAIVLNRPGSPSYCPAEPIVEHRDWVDQIAPAPTSTIKAEPMDTSDDQMVSTYVRHLLKEIRSRDKKIYKARALLLSMADNLHRRKLYRRQLAGLRAVFKDKTLIHQTEMAAMQAQLAQSRQQRECESLANSRLISKQIRLSQTIRQLHIALNKMRHANSMFAQRFAARAQY